MEERKAFYKEVALKQIKFCDSTLEDLNIVLNIVKNCLRRNEIHKNNQITENKLNQKIIRNYKRFYIYSHNFNIEKMKEIHSKILEQTTNYLTVLDDIQQETPLKGIHKEEEYTFSKGEEAYRQQAEAFKDEYNNREALIKGINGGEICLKI